MRKLVITQNMTADGRVEMLDDWFDPQAQSEDLQEELRRQDDDCDAVMLGRRTFEDFRGYWPDNTEDTTGASDFLNATQKYVVSSTLTDPRWANSDVLSGDWLTRVRELKARDGGDIVVTGSITLCHALIDAGLVDEYRLLVYPVVQARGRMLFPSSGVTLRLLETRAFGSGVALLRYAGRTAT